MAMNNVYYRFRQWSASRLSNQVAAAAHEPDRPTARQQADFELDCLAVGAISG
jgi:hypothetical protein